MCMAGGEKPYPYNREETALLCKFAICQAFGIATAAEESETASYSTFMGISNRHGFGFKLEISGVAASMRFLIEPCRISEI